jgi:hypothetical protein
VHERGSPVSASRIRTTRTRIRTRMSALTYASPVPHCKPCPQLQKIKVNEGALVSHSGRKRDPLTAKGK